MIEEALWCRFAKHVDVHPRTADHGSGGERSYDNDDFETPRHGSQVIVGSSSGPSGEHLGRGTEPVVILPFDDFAFYFSTNQYFYSVRFAECIQQFLQLNRHLRILRSTDSTPDVLLAVSLEYEVPTAS